MSRTRAASIALTACLLFAGGGGLDPAAPAGAAPAGAAPADDGTGPLTAVIVDVSSSTADLRAPGGAWEQQWLEAAKGTAAAEGVLWATTADGATLSRSTWTVAGHAFAATIRASPDAHLRVSMLQRPAFLTAVTGYPASAAAGHEVVVRLKARDSEPLPATSDAQ